MRTPTEKRRMKHLSKQCIVTPKVVAVMQKKGFFEGSGEEPINLQVKIIESPEVQK